MVQFKIYIDVIKLQIIIKITQETFNHFIQGLGIFSYQFIKK